MGAGRESGAGEEMLPLTTCLLLQFLACMCLLIGCHELQAGKWAAAMNYRHDVLAGNQKQELEGWVRGSK
eukprot:876459-Pelagomonas_calceolata.AAC.6